MVEYYYQYSFFSYVIAPFQPVLINLYGRTNIEIDSGFIVFTDDFVSGSGHEKFISKAMTPIIRAFVDTALCRKFSETIFIVSVFAL